MVESIERCTAQMIPVPSCITFNVPSCVTFDDIVVKNPGKWNVEGREAAEKFLSNVNIGAADEDVTTFHTSTLFPPLLTTRPMPSHPVK